MKSVTSNNNHLHISKSARSDLLEVKHHVGVFFTIQTKVLQVSRRNFSVCFA